MAAGGSGSPVAVSAATAGSQASLLGSLGLRLPPRFFRESFERHWALLRGPEGAREIFKQIWGLRQVFRHADREGFRAYEFGIPRPAFDPEPGDSGESKAKAAMRRNLTLVQNHVHRSYAPLSRYMRRASAFFGLTGGMNSYTTPVGGVGFGYHFDPSDAFILQVTGSKSWELCSRRFIDPFGFSNLTYNQIPAGHLDVEDCETFKLQEGDAIYLPVGTIHRAAASDGLSVHLTMSLNRQFCSTAAMLLNVAEQINPSKEYGFAQQPFIAWVNAAAASPDGSLASLHNVPQALLCGGGSSDHQGGTKRRRCSPEDGFLDQRLLGQADVDRPLAWQPEALPVPSGLVQHYVEELQKVVELLQAHPKATSEVLRLGVRLEGKPEPVVGNMRPAQVLAGLGPLVKPEPCGRALAAWRNFYARQSAEYDEVIFRAERDPEDDGEDDDLYADPDDADAEEDLEAPLHDPEDELADGSGGSSGFAGTWQEAEEVRGDETSWASQGGQQPSTAAPRLQFVDDEEDEGNENGFDWGYPQEGPEKYDADDVGRESCRSRLGCSGAGGDADMAISTAEVRPGRSGYNSHIRAATASLPASRATTTTTTMPTSSGSSSRTTSPTSTRTSISPTAAAGGGAGAEGSRGPAKVRTSSPPSQPTTLPSPTPTGIVYAVCCTAASARAQVRCANETVPPVRDANGNANDDESRVLIVTYATPHVHSYARYALAVNANWARRFGHSFVVDARDLAVGGVDVKNAKVLVKQHWVAQRDISEQWVLWIGADAVFADFDEFRDDVLRRLLAEHGQDPRVQVMITRDPHGRAGNSLSLFNADVILLRRSEWTASFLQRWWDDPRMKEGRTDQEVLELLYIEDLLGAASAFVLLPPLTLNSDTLTIVSGPPRAQPVIHLGGHTDGIRATVFKEALRLLCERPSGPDPDGLELQEVYIDALRAEARAPSEGKSSGHVHSSAISGTFQRLAWHLEERGHSAEAVEVQRSALRLVKQRFGPKHRDTLQAAIALGGTLRSSGQLEEAESLHRWAYRGMADSLGANHRDTLTTANNLGLVLEARNRHGEAEQLYRMAFEGLRKALGSEAPAALSSAFNLASALTARSLHGGGAAVVGANGENVAAEAERMHRLALRGRENSLGAQSPLALESRDALAQLLVAAGGAPRAKEAEALQRSSLLSRAGGAGAGAGAVAPAADRATVQARSTLAQAVRLQGNTAEAVEHFRIAYTLCVETPALGGPDGPNTFAAATNYASALQDVGRNSEAGALFRDAAKGLHRTLGEEHPNTRGAFSLYERFKKETGSK